MAQIPKDNFFSIQIERYEKRIAKIKRNPNPNMLKSNMILYESLLDFFRKDLKAWEDGKPFCYSETRENSILMAMGLYPIFLSELGDRAGDLAPKYLSLVRERGFPIDCCDRIQIGAALGLSGDLPPPSCVVVEQSECDLVRPNGIWLSKHYNVPIYFIDVPLTDEWESIQYVAEQFAEMVEFLEKNVPGVKYDEGKLIEYLEYRRKEQQFFSRMLEMSKKSPTPIAGKDSLRMPSRQQIGDPKVLEYEEAFIQELTVKAESGFSPLKGEETARISWQCTAPFYDDLFSYFEERGVGIPLYEEGPGYQMNRIVGDDEQYGRRLSPIEECAAHVCYAHWHGSYRRRLNEMVSRAREWNIDGIVHFQQTGCPTCLGTAALLARECEKELGIPSFFIEGHCQDSEGYNREEMEARLDEIIQLVKARKGMS